MKNSTGPLFLDFVENRHWRHCPWLTEQTRNEDPAEKPHGSSPPGRGPSQQTSGPHNLFLVAGETTHKQICQVATDTGKRSVAGQKDSVCCVRWLAQEVCFTWLTFPTILSGYVTFSLTTAHRVNITEANTLISLTIKDGRKVSCYYLKQKLLPNCS